MTDFRIRLTLRLETYKQLGKYPYRKLAEPTKVGRRSVNSHTMSLKDKVEIALWICQSIFYAVSAGAVLFGFFQYSTGVRQRTAETLIRLENRLAGLKDIVRLIDPALSRYSAELSPAVTKSLDELPKTRDEEELIVRLDQFLRFLLLLGGLEKNRLLNRKSLAYMYHYWFSPILKNPDLKAYVAKYFKNLNRFLEDNSATFAQVNIPC